MEKIAIQIKNNYYEAIEKKENIVIYNPVYETKRRFFFLYIILEFIGSPGYGFFQIPLKFLINKNASFINISKRLKIETDGDFQITYNK